MKRKKVCLLLFLFFVLEIVAFLTACNQKDFVGSRTAAPDSYRLDIAHMTGSDLHTLELDGGDVLGIQFETIEGFLYLEIKAPNGTLLYAGNGKTATDFTVNIPEDGVYSVRVEARRAKGNIRIQTVNFESEI